MGNEQCRQEIKEWEKGERERAEVSRSRTATSHLCCRRGRHSGAEGRWWQSHPITPRPPTHTHTFSSFGMIFCAPLNLLPHPPPISYPSSLPLSFVSHFSHLTYALTQNNRISFTSNSSQTYKESQMIHCHKRVPRT